MQQTFTVSARKTFLEVGCFFGWLVFFFFFKTYLTVSHYDNLNSVPLADQALKAYLKSSKNCR